MQIEDKQRDLDILHEQPLLVSVPEAARLLGIGLTFGWELVRSGDLPSVKLGRRVLVPRAALEWLADARKSDVAQTVQLPGDVLNAASRPEVDSTAQVGHDIGTQPTGFIGRSGHCSTRVKRARRGRNSLELDGR